MLRTSGLVAIAIACTWTVGAQEESFGQDFHDATLRADYYHVGNADEELVTLDALHRQGPWAGSRTHLVDSSPLGSYSVALVDDASGRVLYSRGFDSIFGEYRTTEPARRGSRRTYHESALVPLPRRPARLQIRERRDPDNPRVLLSIPVEPTSPTICASPPDRGVTVIEHVVAAPPAATLDLAIVGEGYTANDTATFREDLGRFAGLLLQHEPFASLRSRISIRGVLKPSAEPGCDEPTRGRWRDTAIGASFNALGSPRYLLTENNRALRDIAANVPYDALLIMVNHSRYGGGGIYRTYSVFTAHNRWSEYLLVHEFAHAFAGLADEYYTSSVAYVDLYPADREPAEANITALLDPTGLKWRDLVAPGTPLPTPWEKDAFDALERPFQERRGELNRRIAEAAARAASDEELAALEEELEGLVSAQSERVRSFLATSRWAGRVGAFEGAGYAATGLYRPAVDCLMFSRGAIGFCPVCRRALAETVRSASE